MNPPYSAPAPWVAKFIEHRHGIAYLPFSKSAWFDRLWGAADAIASPGIWASKFVGGAVYMPVFAAAFGPECVDAVSRLGVVRVKAAA